MAETLTELEDFELFLGRKGLSSVTKQYYTLYYKKLFSIMIATEQDINQEIVNAFLDIYPHGLARAFLKNYIEYRDMPLKIQKRTGTVATKEVENIPDNELVKIRQELYSHSDRYGLIFDLSENCALRRQEVLNIKCSDVSIQENEGKLSMFILLKKTKGNKQRKVFVLEETAVRVIKYMKKNNLLTIDYLFKSSKNPDRPIDKTMWNETFTKACLKATGKRYHPHQLRHYRTMNWYDKGIDIVRIQQRLGHSNISTTRLYINPDKRKELEIWSKEID